MLKNKHTESLSTIGEMNYHLISGEIKKLIRIEKSRFLKYSNWTSTNGSGDNYSLGRIAKLIIEEFGIDENWPSNSKTPFLCKLMHMRKISGGWEWKLKDNFLVFLRSL